MIIWFIHFGLDCRLSQRNDGPLTALCQQPEAGLNFFVIILGGWGSGKSQSCDCEDRTFLVPTVCSSGIRSHVNQRYPNVLTLVIKFLELAN